MVLIICRIILASILIGTGSQILCQNWLYLKEFPGLFQITESMNQSITKFIPNFYRNIYKKFKNYGYSKIKANFLRYHSNNKLAVLILVYIYKSKMHAMHYFIISKFINVTNILMYNFDNCTCSILTVSITFVNAIRTIKILFANFAGFNFRNYSFRSSSTFNNIE